MKHSKDTLYNVFAAHVLECNMNARLLASLIAQVDVRVQAHDVCENLSQLSGAMWKTVTLQPQSWSANISGLWISVPTAVTSPMPCEPTIRSLGNACLEASWVFTLAFRSRRDKGTTWSSSAQIPQCFSISTWMPFYNVGLSPPHRPIYSSALYQDFLCIADPAKPNFFFITPSHCSISWSADVFSLYIYYHSYCMVVEDVSSLAMHATDDMWRSEGKSVESLLFSPLQGLQGWDAGHQAHKKSTFTSCRLSSLINVFF